MHLRYRPVFIAILIGLAAPSAESQPARDPARPKLNYDESQVAPYRLPDPLRCADGTIVTDADGWKSKRRAELLDLFARTLYGYTPAGRPAGMHWTVTSDNRSALGGTAERKEVTIWFAAGADGPAMHLLLFEPLSRDGQIHPRWPAFLGLSGQRNAALETASGPADKWQIQKVLARGYATAIVDCNELCPDRKDGLNQGIGRLFGTHAMNERRDDEWGAIGQWAWGLSRALDYLANDPDIDAQRIAVHGHSRRGKAALWAAAQDERFALAISNESGSGGAKLSRRNYGQTIEDITIAFPYWFCPNVARYRKEVDALPVDQHELLALIAPRPLYVASAEGDRLSDPKGEFLSLKAVEVVYRLFGLQGLRETALPPVNTPIRGDAIAYHLRTGKHDITPYDWDQYLAFADQQLKPAPSPPERPRPPTRLPTAPGMPAFTPVGAKPGEPPVLRGAPGMNPPADADGDFLIGPDYVRAPELTLAQDVPKGTVYQITMTSAASKIYPGITKVPPDGPPDYVPPDLTKVQVYPKPYTRTVTVYVPAQYVPGTPAPVIVMQDGPDNNLPVVLDNLIARHRVPAMVAVMIQNGGGNAQGSERGLEYDTMSGRYAEFVEEEVFPLVEKTCGIKISKDPDARAAIGGSSGAAAAFTMAWYHPELYHRVITYSGTFVNQASPFNPDAPHGAWEYHEHLIPQSPCKPIRLWMEVGDRDLLNPNSLRDGMHDWVEANNRMAAALKAKGYHYQYTFALNAGHTDRNVKAQTLPEALEWVWKDYPVKNAP